MDAGKVRISDVKRTRIELQERVAATDGVASGGAGGPRRSTACLATPKALKTVARSRDFRHFRSLRALADVLRDGRGREDALAYADGRVVRPKIAISRSTLGARRVDGIADVGSMRRDAAGATVVLQGRLNRTTFATAGGPFRHAGTVVAATYGMAHPIDGAVLSTVLKRTTFGTAALSPFAA